MRFSFQTHGNDWFGRHSHIKSVKFLIHEHCIFLRIFRSSLFSLKVTTEDEISGCMPSPTQWTWVLVSSGRWWRAGKHGVAELDMTEQLNNKDRFSLNNTFKFSASFAYILLNLCLKVSYFYATINGIAFLIEFLFQIQVQLICNVIFVWGIRHNDSIFHRFYFI